MRKGEQQRPSPLGCSNRIIETGCAATFKELHVAKSHLTFLCELHPCLIAGSSSQHLHPVRGVG